MKIFLAALSRPRLLPVAALALATLLLAGCIQFVEQTMSYRYDAASDTLLIYQRYTGISGESEESGLSDNERAQLDSVLQGERTFFFNNWITELNLSAIRKHLQDNPPGADDATKQAEATLIRLLAESVHISNGPFFLDDQGRLCGVQRVTVRNVTRLLAAGNALIRVELKAEAENETEADKKRLLLQAAAQPEPFITIEGNRIQVRFPWDEHLEEDESYKRLHAEFDRQGGSFTVADGWLTATLGARDSVRETLTLPFWDQKKLAHAGTPNAVPYVTQQVGLATAFDPAKDAERFFGPNRPEEQSP
jgi:hypothetical protein